MFTAAAVAVFGDDAARPRSPGSRSRTSPARGVLLRGLTQPDRLPRRSRDGLTFMYAMRRTSCGTCKRVVVEAVPWAKVTDLVKANLRSVRAYLLKEELRRGDAPCGARRRLEPAFTSESHSGQPVQLRRHAMGLVGRGESFILRSCVHPLVGMALRRCRIG